MNEEKQTAKKNYLLRTVTTVGFITIIIIIAWLSVKLVNYVPEAFSSLASLAESVNPSQSETIPDGPDNIVVYTDKALSDVGEEIVIKWDRESSDGGYIFSYTCTGGVAIDIIGIENLKSISCDTDYNIGNVNSLSLSIDSEKERYVDIPYTITHKQDETAEPLKLGNGNLTVFNDNIFEFSDTNKTEELVQEDTGDVEDTEIILETSDITETSTEPTGEIPVTEPTVSEPTYRQEFVYEIPESNPNGRTDLGVKYLGTGKISGKTFIPGIITRGEDGAIQFEVRNYGTKTSRNWSYTVTLPNEDTYSSPDQDKLKPNERALISIGFGETNTSSHTFVIKVSESTDSSSANNKVVQSVTFAR